MVRRYQRAKPASDSSRRAAVTAARISATGERNRGQRAVDAEHVRTNLAGTLFAARRSTSWNEEAAMGVQRLPIDPDVGIPDLITRLGDDSKRLVSDEVRLAKLELKDNLKRGGKGAMWLGVAFGMGVVALVAMTLVLVTLIGRLAAGHMWIGALVTAILELVVGAVLIKKGIGAFTEPSYTLEQTRDTLKAMN
jgi:hypothetical protein